MSKKKEEVKVVDDLRHNEYYEMQIVYDKLYAQSKNGECFTNLVDLILKEDNITLAYRNIKSNGGSKTPGTDRLNIEDIANLPVEEVVEKVRILRDVKT